MTQTVCGLVMCSTNPTTMGFQTTLPSSVHPLRWTPNSLMRPSYRSPPSIRRFCGGLPQCPRGGTPEPTHSQNAKKDQIFIFFRSTVAATTRKKFLPPAPPWFTVRNTCTGVRTPRRLDRDWIYALNWTQVDGRRLRRRCIQCTGFSEAQIEHIRS